MTLAKIHIHNEDVILAIEEIKGVQKETDGYVLQAMQQLKDKFEENELSNNSIKRKCIKLRNEMVITGGMVSVLDDLVHDFNGWEDIPAEICILLNVLRGRVTSFIDEVIINDKSLIINEDDCAPH